jgi:hypothetical protein
MGSISIRDGGSWKTVPNGTKFNLRDGGAWVNPTKVYVRDAGAWKEVWVKSDPIETTSSVADARSFRRDGANMTWRSSGQEIIGRFDSDDDGDSVLVYQVTNALFGLALDIRPVVKSASFTLKRSSTTGSASFTQTLFLGLYTGTFASGTPSYNSLDFTPNSSRNATWTQGSTYTWNLGTTFGQAVADDLAVGGAVLIALSGRTSSWDGSASGDSWYSKWDKPPAYTGTLTLEIDYS